MPLSEIQKKQLDKLPVNQLLKYIDSGVAIFPQDFAYVQQSKKDAIEKQLANRPNPQEVKEWEALQPEFNDNSSSVKAKLAQYVSKWQNVASAKDHVAQAKERIKNIDEAIEIEDWYRLNLFDSAELISYLNKYPNSCHKDEIDDSLWSLCQNRQDLLSAVREYVSAFPNGRHVADANRILADYADWQSVKTGRDLMEVFNYVSDHSDSPFFNDAKILLCELKEHEILEMKRLADQYDEVKFRKFLKSGVFSSNELIYHEIVTEQTLENLQNMSATLQNLPDIESEILRCKTECAPNRTDIFLLGIPSTGKTCILMGLIGSSKIDVNTVRAGGRYAAALQQYLDAGCLVKQTPEGFVTTLEAEVSSDNGITHYVNLVEMAGEDFAYKLADDPDGKVGFEDMGHGASKLLCNDNRKVFFIVMDPTSQSVRFNRTVKETLPDGSTSQRLEPAIVNQKITLKRMVDILADPCNASIMKKVDSIHIIATKSDMLGDGDKREDNALKTFEARYANIREPLVKLCEKYGINVATNGRPKLYTFSLGKFYVGKIYQYDDTDANKLISLITNNSVGEKKSTFIDKLRDVLNKPVY